MPLQKLRSLFTKTQPTLSNGEAAADTVPSNVRTASTRAKVADHKGQCGLILLNPDDLKPKGNDTTDSYSLDIVAIHGITGDAFKTWTHENGTNWLRDFLPNAFPGVRIFSFGYPAEVFWSRSDGDIDSFARSLLEGLKHAKRRLEHRSRRTIFICHSMGGIVVKKALAIARIDDDDYGDIRTSVSAILFLSTPHRGAGFASLLRLPLQIVASASLPIVTITGKARKDLIKGLEKDAKPLVEISNNFRNLVKDIKIASFVEKSFIPPLKKVIVDGSTGTMGIPGERIVPMHGCDHSTVCRFEGEASFGYQSILQVLQDWADEAKENLYIFSNEDLSCLKSLSFLEMYWRRSEADKAHPDTCNWILEHESYTQWLHEKRGLLWIKGKPGAGKSTLLAYIFRMFQENSSAQADLSLEFFFHGRGTALQKSSIGMYRSLLHQLYVMDKPSRDPIRKAFQDKRIFGEPGLGWEWQLSELQDLFLTLLLTAAKTRRVYIFIDALDEAGSEARDLVGYFHVMNDKLNATGSTAAICISCRHYPVTAIIPGLDVVVEENNHDDIALYVQARLRANIRENQNEIDSKGWSRMEKQIVDDASGVFQWARLVITMVLEHYEEGESWNEIHLKLSKVPRELGAVYEHILSNIIKPERRKKTLQLMQWVFLAERPLTLEELRAAMAFDDTHISSSVQSYKDAEPFLEMYSGIHKLVNSLSGGLAEVKQYDQGNIVQFIHQSVNDFLLSTGLEFLVSKTVEAPPDQSAHEIVRMSTNMIIGHAQDRLSRSCVNYLRLVELNWRKIVPDIGPKQFGLPFIEYATKYWHVHATKAERNEISQEYLIEHFGPTGQLFEKFLKTSVIVSGSSETIYEYGPTFLHLASASDLRSVVRVLLQSDGSVEVEDGLGKRPIHYASRGGNKEVVEMLLKAKAAPEPNSGYKTPIEYAAVNGHREIVEVLLQNGSSSRNALQAAAKAGSASLVKLLLQSGADINASDEKHGNALQAAAENGHEHVVQLLIASGAEINLQGGQYGTALQAAAFHGFESIVQLLLENGANVHLQGGGWGNALQSAISSGNRTIIEAILDEGPDVNAEGGFYGTPLQAAAQEGDLAVFELLLDKGANVNVDAGHHGSPLQAACERGRLAFAKMLIKRGADVNAKSGFHGNPLQAAIFSGNAELVVLLLQNGAQINVLGRRGSVLKEAASRGDCALIDLLLQNGAEIDAGSPRYDTALQAAAVKGHVAATKLLLEKGADANVRGGASGSAIQAAATAGSGFRAWSTTTLLLEHGADVNIQGGKYPNALQAAIAEGDIHIVNLLLRHGALFDPQDDEFSRALIAALEDPDCSVEDMLQERGYAVRPPNT